MAGSECPPNDGVSGGGGNVSHHDQLELLLTKVPLFADESPPSTARVVRRRFILLPTPHLSGEP